MSPRHGQVTTLQPTCRVDAAASFASDAAPLHVLISEWTTRPRERAAMGHVAKRRDEAFVNLDPHEMPHDASTN